MAKGRKKTIIDITPVEENTLSQELVLHIKGKSYPETVSNNILKILSPVFLKIKEWDNKVKSIVIEDENDSSAMAIARESRLFVKNTRIGVKKQIDEQINAIKVDMQPYVDSIDAYKSVFQFAEAMMKGVEETAGEKEKYAERLKQKKIDEKRTARSLIAEPLKQYIGFSFDFGIITDEEFASLIKNAELAKKADEAEKEKQKQEEELRKIELELERRYSFRLSKVHALGMVQSEVAFTYDELSYDLDSLKNNDEETFDLVFTGLEKKITQRKEDKRKKEEEEKAAKEIELEKERQKLRAEAEEAQKKAEEKRVFINNRISQLFGAIIKQDGLYIQYIGESTTEFFFEVYDNIYSMADEEWDRSVIAQNEKHTKYHTEYAAWKEQQYKAQLEARALAMAAEQEAQRIEQAKKIEEQNARVQNEMSDKEKIDRLLQKIIYVSKDIENTIVFQSEYGNKVKNDVVGLLAKIIGFVKNKFQ